MSRNAKFAALALFAAGSTLGVGLFALTSPGAANPAFPEPRPTVEVEVGPAGQRGNVRVALPRNPDPDAAATDLGAFRLVPDTLPDPERLGHNPIAPLPRSPARRVTDRAQIRQSGLFRDPPALPLGFGDPSYTATRSDEGFLFAAVTYRGPRGAFLDVAFRHVLELPIDVLINPTGEFRTPELLEIGGHQALLVRPLPGMPRAVPADLYVFDGQVLTAIRGTGLSADGVLAIADSLFAD